ncbi:hypothetical protein C8Q73DRAFT_794582 [Cubamyces lactineus]|nr:hypothetical protein C8Q73DRAFT_794582 [Cubamyces lactineus]
MPAKTYHDRVRNVFKAFAQNDASSVPLADLIERVEDSIALDLIPPRPGRLARRIRVVHGTNGQVKLELTPYGLSYFREWNVVKLHHEDNDFLHRLTYREACILLFQQTRANPHTVLQLRKETKILKGILREIHEEIQRGGGRYSDLITFEDIPHVVNTVVERVDTLHEQNTELNMILAEDRGMEHNVLAEYPLYDKDN